MKKLRLKKVFLFVHASVISADKMRNEWSRKWFLTQMLFYFILFFLLHGGRIASVILVCPLVGAAVLPTFCIYF